MQVLRERNKLCVEIEALNNDLCADPTESGIEIALSGDIRTTDGTRVGIATTLREIAAGLVEVAERLEE